MRKVVHFEIPADDLGRAKEFYGSVFDWQLQDMEGMEYTSITTVPVDESQMPTEPGAINGGLFPSFGGFDGPGDHDRRRLDRRDTQERRSRRRTVVQSRSEIPGMGAYAYLRDPEGNVVGLWETT